MGNSPRIWLTRPAADSQAFAAQLAACGIESLIAPVMEIAPANGWHVPTVTPTTLLITSRHAVPALAALPQDWRRLTVYCVGESTAQAVQAAGFANTRAGAGDMERLLPLLIENLSAGDVVLYLSGDETRADVTGLLAARGITVQTEVVYHALARTQVDEALLAALRANAIQGVVFFSPRSATLAIAQGGEALRNAAPQMDAFCLSLAIAQAAGALPWRSIQVCDSPTKQAMHDLVVSKMRAAV